MSDYIRIVTSAEASRPTGCRRHLCHPCPVRQSVRVLPRFESAITLHIATARSGAPRTIANTLNNDRWPIDLPGVTPNPLTGRNEPMTDFTMTTDADGVATITWDVAAKSMNVMSTGGFAELERPDRHGAGRCRR